MTHTKKIAIATLLATTSLSAPAFAQYAVNGVHITVLSEPTCAAEVPTPNVAHGAVFTDLGPQYPGSQPNGDYSSLFGYITDPVPYLGPYAAVIGQRPTPSYYGYLFADYAQNPHHVVQFVWGTADPNNWVAFYDQFDNKVASVTGAQMIKLFGLVQNVPVLLRTNEPFAKVYFGAGNVAFEAMNIGFTTKTPMCMSASKAQFQFNWGTQSRYTFPH